jgi:hypothetical protein
MLRKDSQDPANMRILFINVLNPQQVDALVETSAVCKFETQHNAFKSSGSVNLNLPRGM